MIKINSESTKIQEKSTISKDLILSRVREESLMEHYLGISVKKGLFKSPLRKDNHPTCSFYKNDKDEIILHDFRGDFHGNWVSVVMEKFNCDYNKALLIVANDFGIKKTKNLEINKPLIKYSNTTFTQTKESLIQVEIQNFTETDIIYWNNYGITENILKKYKVFSCKSVFLNNELFTVNTKKQLIFGYFGGFNTNDEELWRIYFPESRKNRFLSNWKDNKLQGYNQLPKTGEFLVITKSLKDVMLLSTFNIPAIAPCSEYQFLTDVQYQKLKNRFKKIFLFYDQDIAGRANSIKIRKNYPDITVLLIPKKYECKDISDFYKKYNRIKTEKLITNTKNLFYEEENRSLL